MTTVWFAIAAVIVATLAIFADRTIQARKKQDAAEPEPEQDSKSKTDRATTYVKAIRNRLTGNKQEKAHTFQTWAEANIEDAQLKAWLTGLSTDAASALADQLDDFCASLGFELRWLLDGTMSRDPDIQQEAIAVVADYCRACWHAAQGYNDFETFKVLQDMEQAPFTRKRRDLARRLFGELVKREMASSVPPDLFLASEKEREEHMAKAIQYAAEEYRDRFKTVLKEVVAAEEAGTTDTNGASQPASTETQTDEDSSKQRRGVSLGGFGKGKSKSQSASAEPTTPDAEPASGTAKTEPSAS